MGTVILFLLFCWSLCRRNCAESKYEGCDIAVDSSICIRNGETILLPSARRNGRILFYKFDEVVPVDSSGSGNHGIGQVSGHAGFGGIGTSAYFRKNFVYLPDTGSLKSNKFSVLFFVYLLSDDASIISAQKTDDFCPLVHKGIRNSSVSECTPEIALNPKDGRIRVLLSVESSDTIEVDSNSRLQFHQWYHIALVKDKEALTLYINGIADYVYPTKAFVRFNPLPLYIGSSPYRKNCDMPVLLDELSIYNKAIGRDEIQAEASATLGGIESSYITIGSINCSKQEAMKSCPQGYHLCNKFELYTGGYSVARKLSIPANKIMASASAEPSSGIALCCANLQH